MSYFDLSLAQLLIDFLIAPSVTTSVSYTLEDVLRSVTSDPTVDSQDVFEVTPVIQKDPTESTDNLHVLNVVGVVTTGDASSAHDIIFFDIAWKCQRKNALD